jgi:hypothetical protein
LRLLAFSCSQFQAVSIGCDDNDHQVSATAFLLLCPNGEIIRCAKTHNQPRRPSLGRLVVLKLLAGNNRRADFCKILRKIG